MSTHSTFLAATYSTAKSALHLYFEPLLRIREMIRQALAEFREFREHGKRFRAVTRSETFTEVAELLDVAARNMENYNKVLSILGNQNDELKKTIETLVNNIEVDQHDRLKRQQELNERYETILAQLNVTLPRLLQQYTEWIGNYRKLKKSTADSNR